MRMCVEIRRRFKMVTTNKIFAAITLRLVVEESLSRIYPAYT
jgi:hypothetical protein